MNQSIVICRRRAGRQSRHHFRFALRRATIQTIISNYLFIIRPFSFPVRCLRMVIVSLTIDLSVCFCHWTTNNLLTTNGYAQCHPSPPVVCAYIRSLHFDWCMFHLTFQFSEKSLHLQSIRQCFSMSQSDSTKMYGYFVEAKWQRAIDVNWTAHGTKRTNRFLFFRMISSPKNYSFALSKGTWRMMDAIRHTTHLTCVCVCEHMSTWHAFRIYALQCAVNEWRVADNLNMKRWKLCETNETVADEWPKHLFVQTIRMARSSWTAKNKTNKPMNGYDSNRHELPSACSGTENSQ